MPVSNKYEVCTGGIKFHDIESQQLMLSPLLVTLSLWNLFCSSRVFYYVTRDLFFFSSLGLDCRCRLEAAICVLSREHHCEQDTKLWHYQLRGEIWRISSNISAPLHPCGWLIVKLSFCPDSWLRVDGKIEKSSFCYLESMNGWDHRAEQDVCIELTSFVYFCHH